MAFPYWLDAGTEALLKSPAPVRQFDCRDSLMSEVIAAAKACGPRDA